jgi:chromosomal replication initiation ATPase DnaA
LRQRRERVPNPHVEDIVREVASRYGVPAEEVFSNDRSKTVTRARHEAMRMAASLWQYSEPELGKYFGCDRSTAHNALKGKR